MLDRQVLQRRICGYDSVAIDNLLPRQQLRGFLVLLIGLKKRFDLFYFEFLYALVLPVI